MSSTDAGNGLLASNVILPGVEILPRYQGPAVSPAVEQYNQLMQKARQDPFAHMTVGRRGRCEVLHQQDRPEGDVTITSRRSTCGSSRSASLKSASVSSVRATADDSALQRTIPSSKSQSATSRSSKGNEDPTILAGKSRDELRRIAGIPTVNDFPYQCCEGWKARAPVRPAQYSFNPIRHTVDKFVIDESSGDMKQYKTKRTTSYLEPSACDAVTYNRRKGVVEWGDLQRLTNPRWSRAYHRDFTKNSKIFHRITGPMCKVYDIAVRNKEPNPFRVGR
ncbi:hypothetical protein FOL47_003956 [Perkinsus chesapeaki]|uniref:Uncharacterized protein n=1 Tax=Perkinsus chesapeaki TaxID=330153 RepID=A0A7J6M4Z5_PERCH|nr:hypothetical protein FOL47_003956 [Perkinsus chesapeaki]